MSRHRQNLQVARRPPGQEFRGEPSNGGFGSFNDHRNARYGGGRYEEALGLGNRGRLDDRGRSLGRLAGRLGGLGLGGRRGEGIGGFNSMGGGFMGSPGMYERPSAYSLQSQMRKFFTSDEFLTSTGAITHHNLSSFDLPTIPEAE